jgi:P-type Mg2+ transporter
LPITACFAQQVDEWMNSAMGEAAFWNKSVNELLMELGTTPNGLTSHDAQLRLLRYGPNDAPASKRSPAWARFLSRFTNPLVVILLFASVLSALTGDLASFVIVATIIAASVVMDFLQEQRAQDAVDSLREKVALRVQTLRDNTEIDLPVDQLVPGDVVQLEAGDVIPADGRLLDANYFFINQALLTGEPYPVQKEVIDTPCADATLNEAVNAAFAGASVISGSARLLVCQTGRDTILGEMANTLGTKPPPTAFETGVLKFGALILRITLLLVLFVLTECITFQRPWLESLMFAVALAVGLTPELLPMILTVTLARGAVRLADQRVITKRLTAIHNLGAIDVLCTDKTGTLTEARIRLVQHIDGAAKDSERVLMLAYLNSSFETGLKSPLDHAILEHRKFDITGWCKLDEIPFDFERRRVCVLLEKDGTRLLVVKGAPEDILRLSTSVETAEAAPLSLDGDGRAALRARFDQLSAEGLRTLAIGTRVVNGTHNASVQTDENNLTFAGFVAFVDPPKASAAEAVRELASSGVAIRILTGDSDRVTRHLCAQLDIPVIGVVTGDELAAMSEEALLGALPRLNLFCRVTPQQKLRVLAALKRSGAVVGFLGDGINDASALHAADVGISVDSATDVAKAAADVVLLDHDLTVLHNGVVEGRRTVINVQKYILMASSANFGNIVSTALAGLFLPFLPMLPIQVLLTNLLYDFAQASLPFDNVDTDAIERPVHWNIDLIKRFMLIMGPVSTLFDLITFGVLIVIFHAGMIKFRTGWFVESLVTQLLMVFSVRTRHHPLASRPHPLVTSLTLAITAVTLALPFTWFGRWFGFAPVSALYFGFLLIAVAGFLTVIEAVKRRFYIRMSGSTADPAPVAVASVAFGRPPNVSASELNGRKTQAPFELRDR